VSIEVLNESGEVVDETTLSALATHVLDRLDVHPLAELSIVLVDVTAMTELHEKWMNEPGPTDVLAFPMDELRPGHVSGGTEDAPVDPALLGDVVLCPAVAVRQARAAGHSMADELLLLATHGVLHLLGYDHMEPDEEKEMFGLQQKLIDGWRSAPREPVTGEPAAKETGPR
jgi:probable rRNA maturation factor